MTEKGRIIENRLNKFYNNVKQEIDVKEEYYRPRINP